jgi:predicted nuclease of predicted toxin-antitoxin system
MRFLANENIARDVIVALRAAGHEVAWIREDAPGSADEDVLARAQAELRVLLTFDKDFGELAFSRRLPAACGVILLRFATPSPSAMTTAVLRVIAMRDDWSGHFSVVDDDRIRMTPLPST